MPRPCKHRHIRAFNRCDIYKPQGVPARKVSFVILETDEIEAIRLADQEGLYQADAAQQMGISRQTFGNIITRAHQKIADALLNGKAIQMGVNTSELPEELIADDVTSVSSNNQQSRPCRGRGRRRGSRFNNPE